MPNFGRKPNVMPILDETNIEALLKLKSSLEQSIESAEAKTNLGNTLEKLLKHWFFCWFQVIYSHCINKD